MARATFYDQIAANRRNSFLLAAFVVVLLGVARVRDRLRRRPATPRAASPRPALALARRGALAGIGSYFAGDTLVLARPGAQEVDETQRAAADERRARDGDRGERPDAARLPHRRHGPERLRDRPRPEARLGRDHDRPAREARPRGAPGRHRPRAVARPQLRHPLLADRRRARRVDRAPGRLLPALHVLGRRPRRDRDRDGGGGAPGDRLHRRDRRWRSSRRSSAGSSSSPSAASASTSPTPRRSSSPATRTAWSGRWPRSRPTRRCSRSPTAAPSTCTSPTRSRSSRSASSGLFSTHPPILDRINRLRELTGEPPLGDAERGALWPGWSRRSSGPRTAGC